MRKRISTTTRIAATALAAIGIAAGTGAVGAGTAAADGLPGGPFCSGPAKVLAESSWSRVAICPVQGPTGWAYEGIAKTTGDSIEIWGATWDANGFHAGNNGYTYHVHRDRLMITAPNGTLISDEPWLVYQER